MLGTARTHPRLIAAAMGSLVAVGIFWVAGGASRGASPPSPLQASLHRFDSHPMGPGATETRDLTADIAKLPFTPILPRSGDAIQKVWLRTDIEPGLAVRYESGVTILESVAEPIDFPTDKYYSQLAEGLRGTSTTIIDGVPAMVIQSTKELGNPSSVDLILQGVQVSTIGNVGQDAQELVALAETFEERV
jgi:hypothetical protein